MGDISEIRELIRAAAEGATGGVQAMRAAGLPAALGGFAVEIDYAGGVGPGREMGAVVRLSITVPGDESGCGGAAGEEPGRPPATG